MSDAHAVEPAQPGETPKPPGLPEIRDEAADSPRWLPLVGLGVLLALGAIFGTELWRSHLADEAHAREVAAATEAAAKAAAEAPTGDGAPPANAPANAPAPAPAPPPGPQ